MSPARILSVSSGVGRERADKLVTEEPMEIRAGGPGQEPVSVAVTMRTPGNDFELAAGLLFTEGLVSAGEIVRVSYCDALEGDQDFNVVTVRLPRPFDPTTVQRNFFATSSCGVCGKATLDQIEVVAKPLAPGPTVASTTIGGLVDAMRPRQKVFESTGGLHAAALFRPDGSLVVVREDVGRHNAVDKLVGHALLNEMLPLSDALLMVSGRLGFEILQKAVVAGIPIVCAISAPSSLAVDAGERLGATVIGFVRGDDFNIYSHPERIDLQR